MSDSSAPYDTLGHDYAVTSQEFFKTERCLAREFIRNWIKEPVVGMNLLDVGCGEGEDLVYYGRMPFDSVIGVDPSVVSVRSARANTNLFNRVIVEYGEFEHTGLPALSVDFVTSRFALHYLRNFDKAYAEVARVLKPGGLFVFAADHPLTDHMESEKAPKDGITYVRTKLFHGAVELPLYPLHSISEYLSQVFLKHFELLRFEEATGADRDWQGGPNMLLIAARKK